MVQPIQFAGEVRSNAARAVVAESEPQALRTFTPTQAVFAKSAGIFHFTPEGRKLYDFTSGVLVANLGHNPRRWLQRFAKNMNWSADMLFGTPETAAQTSPVPQLRIPSLHSAISGPASSKRLPVSG